MTDIHILGMARSGTSIVEQYLYDRLTQCSVEVMDLREFFSPYFRVGYTDVLHMEFDVAASKYYSLPERISIFEQFKNHNKLVKQIHWDNARGAVDYSLLNGDAVWIIIVRPDVVDHFLSYAIAENSNTWNVDNTTHLFDYRKSIKPFEVSQRVIDFWIKTTESFRDTRKLVEESGANIQYVSYDNLHYDCDKVGKTLLRKFGISESLWIDHTDDNFFNNQESQTYKKLFTLDEKQKLVTNWKPSCDQIVSVLGKTYS